MEEVFAIELAIVVALKLHLDVLVVAFRNLHAELMNAWAIINPALAYHTCAASSHVINM